MTTSLKPHVFSMPRSRLAQEISDGKLWLQGDHLARYNFYFSVGPVPIGIYGARSFSPGRIRLVRSWNTDGNLWDPFLNIEVPFSGRQFHKVMPNQALFLAEFDQQFTRVVDRIAFKAERVKVFDGDIPTLGCDKKFEFVELSGITLLG